MVDVFKPTTCNSVSRLSQLVLQEAERGVSYVKRVRIEFHAGAWPQLTVWTVAASGRPQPPDSSVDLATGLAQVLVRIAGGAGERAVANDESLFIATGASFSTVAAMLRRLETYATPSRVTHCTRAGDDVWLLHVNADHRRGSGLPGLKNLGLFEGWSELTCYAHDDLCVFLPAGVRPPRDQFADFCDVVMNRAVAAALELHPQGPDDERFYIVAPGSGGTFEALILPERSFVDGSEVPSIAATARVVRLAVGVPRPDLLSTLAEVAPAKGYRLRLRPTRRHGHRDAELMRLRGQQAELEQRIAYLESIKPARPYLLRFGPRQLKALAQAVYSFGADALFESPPLVRYAFQATEREPEGFHYLLVQPMEGRVAPDPPDPLVQYDAPPHMRFWLDPSWGRHYHDEHGNRAYVFVPERFMLFPSLHTWSPRNMDAHLGDVLAKPALERMGASTLPPDPFFYVFDALSDTGDDLELTVLDRTAFGPLEGHLHWLSDNLTVAAWRDAAPALSKTAAAIRCAEVANDAAKAARLARGQLHREARRTVQGFADELGELVRDVTEGTARVLHRAREIKGSITTLDATLAGLVDIPGRRSQGIKEIEALLAEVGTAAQTLTDKLAGIEVQTRAALKTAGNAREAEARAVAQLLESLCDARTDLQRKLREACGQE